MHSRSAYSMFSKNALQLPVPTYLTYHLAVSQKINTLQIQQQHKERVNSVSLTISVSSVIRKQKTAMAEAHARSLIFWLWLSSIYCTLNTRSKAPKQSTLGTCCARCLGACVANGIFAIVPLHVRACVYACEWVSASVCASLFANVWISGKIKYR